MGIIASRSAESRARATRFKVEDDLKVSSRTIGTGTQYTLMTNDLSRSGLLLSWRHRVNGVPFRENTLIEMVIDPDKQLLSEPVECIGKVVRKVVQKAEGREVHFGIRIVQIENNDMNEWENCIDYLSTNHQHLIMDDKEFLKKNAAKKLKGDSRNP